MQETRPSDHKPLHVQKIAQQATGCPACRHSFYACIRGNKLHMGAACLLCIFVDSKANDRKTVAGHFVLNSHLFVTCHELNWLLLNVAFCAGTVKFLRWCCSGHAEYLLC